MKFLVIICHVTPQDVPGEIDLLIDVYEWAKAKYDVEVRKFHHTHFCKSMPLVRLGLTLFCTLSVTSSAALYKVTLFFGFGGSR